MTKIYVAAAFRLVLSLATPNAAQAWSGPASVGIAPPTAIACPENDERTECSSAVVARGMAVALARKAMQPHPYVRRSAQHPTYSPPPPSRSPAHEEDPLASMHFE